ncbi:MAG: hypothetical protein HeimC3_11760 [Candidatus Heimdallarchaeota archaeon LC_3]|nr:MAG: hypothetical protein HeimC3_11760 [Candidatus Heimdallarchaeota archaeon LC_3]
MSSETGDVFNTIVLCPVCLKPDLKMVSEITSIWATPPKRYCPHCNYNGIMVFEMDKKEYYNIPEDVRDESLRKIREETLNIDINRDQEDRVNLGNPISEKSGVKCHFCKEYVQFGVRFCSICGQEQKNYNK